MQSSVIATYVNSEKVCIFCDIIINHSDVETRSIILSLTTCKQQWIALDLDEVYSLNKDYKGKYNMHNWKYLQNQCPAWCLCFQTS